MKRFGMEFNQKTKDTYEVIDIFPLAFFKGKISCHEELKNSFVDDIKNNRSEFAGLNLFHMESGKYEILFDSLKENLNNYVSVLGIDHTKLSYHISNSWIDYKGPDSEDTFDINDNRYEANPAYPHWHNHSDLTFVYYISANETSDRFYLENCFGNQNDFDALLEIATNNNIIMKWNKYNTKHHIFQPEEGYVIILPSRLYHYTRRSGKRRGDRITIGGDIRVTSNLSGAMQSQQLQTSTHPSLWREL